jgi:hypothetical protein
VHRNDGEVVFMEHQLEHQRMQECAAECLNCYRVCTQMLAGHCLDAGGKHVEPAHFRLMLDCADICQTSANFLLRGSTMHQQICAITEEICEACATSCEQVGDMDECVAVCRTCAEQCRKMAMLIES